MKLSDLESLALQVVQAEKQKLPADIVRALSPVQLRFMPFPDEELVAEGLDDLLGLFEGNNLLDGDPDSAADMPRVTLFLQNIREEAGENLKAYQKEVRITWPHEIGHYLGWDEEEVEARGLG